MLVHYLKKHFVQQSLRTQNKKCGSGLMWWFRRSLDLKQSITRFSSEVDIPQVTRFLRDGSKHYLGFTHDELPELLTNSHAVVLEHWSDIWGVAMASDQKERTTWLRCIALDRGVNINEGLAVLLPPLHEALYKRGLRAVFYAGDESSDEWLVPALSKFGYVQETDVIVYEKHGLDIPHPGNQFVSIRPACLADIQTLRNLDRACFDVQWAKDQSTLQTSLAQPGLFVVAELSQRVVGYAHSTNHFDGRLQHLVRIAVEPSQQGQAIGVRLLAEVVENARRQRANVITLNTQLYNNRAQRLYRWFGFVQTGEQQSILRFDL